jgi:hypothetical protein
MNAALIIDPFKTRSASVVKAKYPNTGTHAAQWVHSFE